MNCIEVIFEAIFNENKQTRKSEKKNLEKYYYLFKFKSISKIRFNDSSGTDDEDD